MVWLVIICLVAVLGWLAMCQQRSKCIKKHGEQIPNIGITEASRRWPRCTISSMSGNLYVAYRNKEIVGTTYYESQLALEHKAYATKDVDVGKVSMLLPQTIGTDADTRDVVGTKYVVMNVLEFPKTRTGGARAEFVFCNEEGVLLFIGPKDIQHDVYVPKASIGCVDLKMAIYIGPQLHLFAEVPLRIRSVGKAGCRQVWNDSFDARAVSRPIGLAFSYLADMTEEEIKKESDEWAEQFRVHNEIEQLCRDI